MRRRLAALLLALPAVAAAQPASTSPAPERVAVTVYRNPHRGPGDEMELEWLGGYALISETRRVTIPAGEGDIRFEGVAGGILPESAIVTGLPDGVVEKNQDAWLLSPASLLDRSLGRRVHLRRTSRATGQVREQEAVIRSGAGGAVVLETENGFEALRCTGIPEKLVYDRVPEGLSARPTLSVRTRSRESVSATVTLSYLAGGFDWQANYIATVAPGGDRLDLFAWVTLANGDETSFVNADTQTVAGRLNRVEQPEREALPDPYLSLRCWPQGTTTSDLRLPPPPPPPPPPPVVSASEMALVSADSSENIIVTGSRIVRQEELGDLKLYRVPEPVTVAANSQKQVALMDKDGVRFEKISTANLYVANDGDDEAAKWLLRIRNSKESGLGLPLPGGKLVLFEKHGGRPVLIGEGTVRDTALDEELEIELGEHDQLRTAIRRNEADSERIEDDEDLESYELEVTNAGDRPAPVEIVLSLGEDEKLEKVSAKLGRKNGRPLWRITVPANGRAILRYRVRELDTGDDD